MGLLTVELKTVSELVDSKGKGSKLGGALWHLCWSEAVAGEYSWSSSAVPGTTLLPAANGAMSGFSMLGDVLRHLC